MCVHFRSSPDCSISCHRSALQGRGAFIYPCESGCDEKRLTGSSGRGMNGHAGSTMTDETGSDDYKHLAGKGESS